MITIHERFRAGALLVALAATACLSSSIACAAEALAIAREGVFYIGGKYVESHGDMPMVGQAFVEYRIPEPQTHPYPIVLVHGGSQTGTGWISTPDGRDGWAIYFLRHGYAVYIIDQVARGRSAYIADVYGPERTQTREYVMQRFSTSEKYNLWPQAKLHTQWPGTGEPGDPTFDNYFASNVPSMEDRGMQSKMNVDALAALLDRVGPAIVLVHSQSGQYAWPLAQARPALVKAIVGAEPSGPPVHDVVIPGEARFGMDFANATAVPGVDIFRDDPRLKRYGLSDIPMTYDPPVTAQSPLEFVRQDKADAPDLVKCWRQKEPARKLVDVGGRPILYLATEASFYAPYSHCTVAYLRQAGVDIDFVKLADLGLHGNGHMMMMEKNSDAIAQVILDWLDRRLPASASAH
ncbi:MAG TPA: alpha/beta hydrolase [Xanthobacteraceae bacterium]|nr:alpha/beta hydrolase [Xanthobacteraceae bacterium]